MKTFRFLDRCWLGQKSWILAVLVGVALLPRLAQAADLLEAAAADGRFTNLVNAVQAAGLRDLIKATPPSGLTLFAPTDEAFARLSASTVAGLLADPDRLRRVIQYHVVKTGLRSGELANGPLLTVSGDSVDVEVSQGGVRVNGARVVVADVVTSNGVLHGIDNLLVPPGSLLDLLAGQPQFSTLVRALNVAGAAESFAASGSLTLFAPNNAAFEKLSPGALDDLLSNPVKLKTLLLYHALNGRVDLKAGTVTTLQGSDVVIGLDPGPTVNGNKVIAPDQSASNGILHEVDGVLIPPLSLLQLALSDPQFSTLAAAVQAAGLSEVLDGVGAYTVFAPNNAAFDKLPPGTLTGLLGNSNQLRAVLLYHVVSGRLGRGDLQAGPIRTVQGGSAVLSLIPVPTIDGARILTTDIPAANGTLHVIDTVLNPPKDIASLVQDDPSLSSLAAAFQAADFPDKLKQEGPFTLFAPSNEAFGKLPPDVLAGLLGDPEKLRELLFYHVVPSRVVSAQFKNGVLPTALGGTGALISLEPAFRINQASIVITDIRAANGIIHVIDSVLEIPPTLGEIAGSDPSFSTLFTAVEAAGLSDLVLEPGATTLFAPNNEAFSKLPGDTLTKLLADPPQLKTVLLYHLVGGRVRPDDLKQGKLRTLQGSAVQVNKSQGLKVNEAEVYLTDVEASNGVLYGIDQVLLPPPNLLEVALSKPEFSTLAAAVDVAGLKGTLNGEGPFTVFAPNNAAFAKLPADVLEGLLNSPAKLRQVLLYHVVSGRVLSGDLKSGGLNTVQGAAATVSLSPILKINDANVLAADLEAGNGVLHVLDTVLLPPPTLGELLGSNPDFSILATAVEVAGLTRLVLADRATTVFAPRNAAFEKLPPGVLADLLADTNRLKSVLLYHLVKGRVRSGDLKAGALPTLQGAAVRVGTTGGITIENARVIAADVEAGNGIVHVLNSVLLPPARILEVVRSNPQLSTFVAAVSAAGLSELLEGDGPYTLFAPENAAFGKLPPGTLSELLANPVRLRHILLYHLQHGPRLRSSDLKNGRILTLQGAQALINVSSTGVKINQSTVVAADAEAFNGVIHVIDQVLLPGDGFSGVTLSTVVKDGKATVVWPFILGADLKLESAPTLNGPWSPVDTVVITADGIQKTEVPARSPQQFFRVRSAAAAPVE